MHSLYDLERQVRERAREVEEEVRRAAAIPRATGEGDPGPTPAEPTPIAAARALRVRVGVTLVRLGRRLAA